MNALHLLKLEWSKYSPNGTFRVFAALYAGSFALIVFLARSAGQNMTVTSNGANHLVNSNSSTHPLSATEAAFGALVYMVLFALLFCRKIIKADL